MTDDKKHDDKDRKKLSDEEMEDVAGGTVGDVDHPETLQWSIRAKKKDGGGNKARSSNDPVF
jgi:hypothetical protein